MVENLSSQVVLQALPHSHRTRSKDDRHEAFATLARAQPGHASRDASGPNLSQSR